MNELIKIQTNDNFEQIVSARDLYEALGIEKKFTDWFKMQIERLGLNEGLDFIPFWGESTGGRPSTDYHVTIDIAKHIAMISGGENGRKVREYFIQVEKAWNDPDQVMARAAIIGQKRLAVAMQRVQLLEVKIEADKPKVDYFDTAVDRTGLFNFRDTAYSLGVKQNDMINLLVGKRWLYRGHKSKLKFHSEYGPTGKHYFELKDFTAKNEYSGSQTMITAKGKAAILKLLKDEGFIETMEVELCQ